MFVAIALLFSSALAHRSALQHVVELMAPASAADLRQLATTGAFERRIAHENDVYGGSVHAHLAVRMHAHRMHFISGCQREKNLPMGLVRLASSSRIRTGDVVFGDLCGFCDEHSSDHACAAEAIVRESGEIELKSVRTDSVMALVESLDVSFKHVPGNRTRDEALREARKRGDVAESAVVGLQFDVIDFNFDDKTGVAAKPLPLPELSKLLAAEATCFDCFAKLTAGVEFALRLATNGYGVPVLEHFELVLTGELKSAAILGAAWPLSLDAEYRQPLVEASLSPVPLVIPIGLLAITIRPKFTLDLEAEASFGVPLNVTLGARQSMSLRTGLQVVRGQPVRRIQACDQSTAFETSFTGFPGVLDVALEATAGVKAALALDVGLTLAVLALVPTHPLVTVDVSASPFVKFEAGFEPECAVVPADYNITSGLLMGVSASPFQIKIGPVEFSLSVGGVLPFEAEFDAIQAVLPAGCRACQGCLLGGPLKTELPRAQGPTAVAPPLPPKGTMVNDAFDVTVTGAVALGAPLTIAWKHGLKNAHADMQIADVTFAVELRRAANDTELQFVTTTSEQLDVRVTGDSGQLALAALRPFAAGAVAQVRFVVIAGHSDSVFGRSAWLDVARGSGSGAATRVYSGWQACSEECGSGVQNRTALCVSGDGAQTLASSACATPLAALTRPCRSLGAACPFVRYSILWPNPKDVVANVTDWTRDNSHAIFNFEFAGGQAGHETTVSICERGTYSHCNGKKPTGCQLELSLPISTAGTTRSAFSISLRQTTTLLIPLTFALLLQNKGGGADEWRLSPTYVVRTPGVFYIVHGETSVLSGPVSVASIHGTAVLAPPAFKVETGDIGQIVQVALTTTAPFRTMSIATSAQFLPFISPTTITDERKVKTPGLLVAHCNPTFLRCAVCDANDTSCAMLVPEQAWAIDRLPPACHSTNEQDVWATGAPGVVTVGGGNGGSTRAVVNGTTAFFGSPDSAPSSVAISSLIVLIAAIALN